MQVFLKGKMQKKAELSQHAVLKSHDHMNFDTENQYNSREDNPTTILKCQNNFQMEKNFGIANTVVCAHRSAKS